jgi:hypothetical protein
MNFGTLTAGATNDLLFLALTAGVAALASFLVFAACFFWFRREQQRLLRSIRHASRGPAEFVTRHKVVAGGELVAQFKVNRGRQVLSLMEADGRRFIHVDGELTRREREKLIRYLKSEGFMS